MRRILLCLLLGAGGLAHAQNTQLLNISQNQPSALIDYGGFSQLTEEVRLYRENRLISKDDFLAMAKDPNTIILDTRSKAAFDMGHIKGAVHLNFSDFTEDKLAKVVGSKDTRILIYCNNNFSDNIAPMLLKRVQLALNIPTFINLYGYGYKDIYELGDTVSIHDPDMQIVPPPNDMFTQPIRLPD